MQLWIPYYADFRFKMITKTQNKFSCLGSFVLSQLLDKFWSGGVFYHLIHRHWLRSYVLFESG